MNIIFKTKCIKNSGSLYYSLIKKLFISVYIKRRYKLLLQLNKSTEVLKNIQKYSEAKIGNRA